METGFSLFVHDLLPLLKSNYKNVRVETGSDLLDSFSFG